MWISPLTAVILPPTYARVGSADLMQQPEMLGFKRTGMTDEIVAHNFRHTVEKIEGPNGSLGERIREIGQAHS